MAKTIDITIKNKIAVQTNDTVYVCGNSDYVINFDFDAEWAEHECKIARFIFNGTAKDVPFSNNECPVPIISDTYKIKVGVYVGDLQTTTPALVSAKKSILCGTPTPAAPHPDVYAQMKELFEAGLDKAWKGANAATEAKDAAQESQDKAEAARTEAQDAEYEATRQATAAQKAKDASELAQENAEASEAAAAQYAEQAKETVNNAAWIDAEINDDGHLILTQSDNFNGATFALNDNGNLEVSYT